MRKSIFFLIAAMLAAFAPAMAQSADGRLTKQERKLLQQRIDSLQHEEAVKALRDTTFTLEADYVVFKRGYRAYVSSRTNFVSVDKDHAVVQLSFNVPVAGPNGMGGITVEGMMTGYELETDRRGTVTARFNVLGAAISAQLLIRMYAGRNEATVDVMPNFNSNRLTFEGVILPADSSFVVQGRTI